MSNLLLFAGKGNQVTGYSWAPANVDNDDDNKDDGNDKEEEEVGDDQDDVEEYQVEERRLPLP